MSDRGEDVDMLQCEFDNANRIIDQMENEILRLEEEVNLLWQIKHAAADLYFAGTWHRSAGQPGPTDKEYWQKLKDLTGWSVTNGRT